MSEFGLVNLSTTGIDWNYSLAVNVIGVASAVDNSSLQDENKIILEHAPRLSKPAVIRVIVLSAMAIVSLLGNTATMWNIYKTRMMRRVSRHSWSAIYSLIFHLSIADLLVTGFCIIGEAAWSYTVQWLAGEFACKAVKLFQMFSLYLSTYVLVLIGVDRWIAVKYPMKSLNMAKRCYRLLGGAYVLSFVLSLPQTNFWKRRIGALKLKENRPEFPVIKYILHKGVENILKRLPAYLENVKYNIYKLLLSRTRRQE